MRSILTLLLATAFAASAQAQVNNAQFGGANAASAAQSGSIAGSSSGAGAAAQIEQNFNTPALVETRQSGGTTIDQDINYSGKYTIRNTPNIAPPNILPTSPCMGSSSIGVGVSGFGIGGGSSWKDADCGYRETARVFLQAGMAADGIAVLCASEYASSAPACVKLRESQKKADAPPTQANARDAAVRDANERNRQATTLGVMSKSQQDEALTKTAMLPTKEQQKAANCQLAGDDQILRARFECGIQQPVAFKQ